MKVLQINEAKQVAGGEFALANHNCIEYAKNLRAALKETNPNAADDYYRAFEIAVKEHPTLLSTAPCDEAELKSAFAGLAIQDFVNSTLGR